MRTSSSGSTTQGDPLPLLDITLFLDHPEMLQHQRGGPCSRPEHDSALQLGECRLLAEPPGGNTLGFCWDCMGSVRII